MDFGFTLKPGDSVERTLGLTRTAEAAGFSHGWLFDSHVLWRDPYPLLTLMAEATTTMRLGTCVTNPATREPSVTASSLATLDDLSGGRMDLGIGRGDSARRVLGKPPTTIKDLEEAVHVIRALVEGRPIEFEGAVLQLAAAGLDRRLRPGRAPPDRSDRRRGDAPDRGPGPDPLVRRPGP
jgi:alkanesulfonate monooxygenase SsuD/methylene tetrahydromethanopterin reductase-like flavin-dependent oxidoreductase (luciferase family)